MAYSEQLLAPMRRDLTQYGVEETRTPADVDAALGSHSGTVLMVLNAVCGCAAGNARPAVGMALRHSMRPNRAVTVFAGGDVEATAHLRAKYLANYPVSSPSMALFQDGKAVYHMHRSEIESRTAVEIAKDLMEAFEQHCAPVAR